MRLPVDTSVTQLVSAGSSEPDIDFDTKQHKLRHSSNRQSRGSEGGRAALLDIPGVARALAVTPRHIQRLVAERRIPFLKVGRFVRFDPGELDLWLEQQRVEVRRSASFSRTTGR
jgi:excisionase family DNA binding protein